MIIIGFIFVLFFIVCGLGMIFEGKQVKTGLLVLCFACVLTWVLMCLAKLNVIAAALNS